MKTNQALTADCLTGRWKITSFYIKTNLGWTLTKRYGLNSFIWKFGSDGKLTEKRKGLPDFHTSYALSLAEQELFIDRTDTEPSNVMSISSRYKIERINQTDCWLYIPDNLPKEPENYKCRMKIKKEE